MSISKKAIILGAIMIFVMVWCETVSISYAQPADGNKEESEEWYDNINNEYVFPVDSASDEWKNFKSHKEMTDACTIPENLIELLSTDELYNLVIKYPLLIDIFAYDSETQGFAQIRKHFNGLEVLLGREDVADVLLSAYSEVELPSEQQNEFDTLSKIQFLELMLTDKSIIDKMSGTQKDKLAHLAYENYCKKQINSFSEAYEGKIYEYANDNGTLDEINNLKKSKLDINGSSGNIELYASEGFRSVKSSNKTFIRTPKGSKVVVTINSEYSKTTIQDLNESYKNQYPNAKFVYSASRKYNCHSYAWHWRSKYNSYWMNGRYAELYVTDGSYRAIATYPTGTGQKVVWHDYDREGKVNFIHSGILRSFKSPYDKTGIMIESKWGDGPVMLHDINYCPYNYITSHLYYIKN